MMIEGLSAVLLNWKRPTNVERIVAGWRRAGIVNDGIVWNNNGAAPVKHAGVRVVNTQEDWGLYTRFAAGCLARNDCVLIQDDDLELPSPSLAALYDAWRRSPLRLHGIFGRALKPDGAYAVNIHGDADAPIILTRAVLVHKSHFADFFRFAAAFEPIQRQSRPLGNGEDILLSYVAMRTSGQLNRVHKLPVHELPAPDAIHARDWEAHVTHRTQLVRACEEWMRASRERGEKDGGTRGLAANP